MNAKKFFTSSVTYITLGGVILILLGQADFLHYIMPNFFKENSLFNPVVKSIGAALIGSGVFTAIIKSKAYTEIFSEVIGQIIWSKKYIEKRTDKKEIWSMISKLMYDEKFPEITNELEEIITTEYFPVSHQFYTENSNILINISDLDANFWKQTEVISIEIKPIDKNAEINYQVVGNIDLPDDDSYEDLTDYKITSIVLNGNSVQIPDVGNKRREGFLYHGISLNLKDSDQYSLTITREKVVCKRTNPDKRTFAKHIIKDAKVTVICPASLNISFHKMGTIRDFEHPENQINNGIKFVSWTYKGVILPHQGYILIFK